MADLLNGTTIGGNVAFHEGNLNPSSFKGMSDNEKQNFNSIVSTVTCIQYENTLTSLDYKGGTYDIFVDDSKVEQNCNLFIGNKAISNSPPGNINFDSCLQCISLHNMYESPGALFCYFYCSNCIEWTSSRIIENSPDGVIHQLRSSTSLDVYCYTDKEDLKTYKRQCNLTVPCLPTPILCNSFLNYSCDGLKIFGTCFNGTNTCNFVTTKSYNLSLPFDPSSIDTTSECCLGVWSMPFTGASWRGGYRRNIFYSAFDVKLTKATNICYSFNGHIFRDFCDYDCPMLGKCNYSINIFNRISYDELCFDGTALPCIRVSLYPCYILPSCSLCLSCFANVSATASFNTGGFNICAWNFDFKAKTNTAYDFSTAELEMYPRSNRRCYKQDPKGRYIYKDCFEVEKDYENLNSIISCVCIYTDSCMSDCMYCTPTALITAIDTVQNKIFLSYCNTTARCISTLVYGFCMNNGIPSNFTFCQEFQDSSNTFGCYNSAGSYNMGSLDFTSFSPIRRKNVCFYTPLYGTGCFCVAGDAWSSLCPITPSICTYSILHLALVKRNNNLKTFSLICNEPYILDYTIPSGNSIAGVYCPSSIEKINISENFLKTSPYVNCIGVNECQILNSLCSSMLGYLDETNNMIYYNNAGQSEYWVNYCTGEKYSFPLNLFSCMTLPLCLGSSLYGTSATCGSRTKFTYLCCGKMFNISLATRCRPAPCYTHSIQVSELDRTLFECTSKIMQFDLVDSVISCKCEMNCSIGSSIGVKHKSYLPQFTNCSYNRWDFESCKIFYTVDTNQSCIRIYNEACICNGNTDCIVNTSNTTLLPGKTIVSEPFITKNGFIFINPPFGCDYKYAWLAPIKIGIAPCFLGVNLQSCATYSVGNLYQQDFINENCWECGNTLYPCIKKDCSCFTLANFCCFEQGIRTNTIMSVDNLYFYKGTTCLAYLHCFDGSVNCKNIESFCMKPCNAFCVCDLKVDPTLGPCPGRVFKTDDKIYGYNCTDNILYSIEYDGCGYNWNGNLNNDIPLCYLRNSIGCELLKSVDNFSKITVANSGCLLSSNFCFNDTGSFVRTVDLCDSYILPPKSAIISSNNNASGINQDLFVEMTDGIITCCFSYTQFDEVLNICDFNSRLITVRFCFKSNSIFNATELNDYAIYFS